MPQDSNQSATASVLAVGPSTASDPAAAAGVRGLTEALERSGHLSVSLVSVTDHGVPALAEASASGFDAVLLLTSLPESLPKAQWQGLEKLLEAGGGLVATQPTLADAGRDTRLAQWLGARPLGPATEPFRFSVHFDHAAAEARHPVAARAQGFTLRDRLLPIEPEDTARVLAATHLDAEPMPVALSHETKRHHAIAITLGGEPAALRHESVRQLIERSVRSVCGPPATETVRVGILGYGGTFHMGHNHVEWMSPATGLEVVAVCDHDPERTERAKQELASDVRVYDDMQRLVGDSDVELVVIVLPHDAHAEATVAALNAGKHVVVEKPMALTLDEADRMIDAAKEAGVMLSCFHNHRWDGDVTRLRELVRAGEIGGVYHVDVGTAHYAMPRPWWRSSKTISGGVLYDWGAHHIDALLSLVQKRIASVSGHLQKRYWHHMTNEDYAHVVVRFEDGTTATMEQGELAAIQRPRWRVLATDGGIHAPGRNEPITLVRFDEAGKRESTVESRATDWPAFYRNIANHLLLGEPLAVTPSQARRVIGVLELAERSSNQGGTPLELPGEDTIDPHYDAPLA